MIPEAADIFLKLLRVRLLTHSSTRKTSKLCTSTSPTPQKQTLLRSAASLFSPHKIFDCVRMGYPSPPFPSELPANNPLRLISRVRARFG